MTVIRCKHYTQPAVGLGRVGLGGKNGAARTGCCALTLTYVALDYAALTLTFVAKRLLVMLALTLNYVAFTLRRGRRLVVARASLEGEYVIHMMIMYSNIIVDMYIYIYI